MTSTPQPATSQYIFSQWIAQLKQNRSVESAIEFFIKTAPVPILYFKHLPLDSWLVLEHIKKTETAKAHLNQHSICLRLYESDPSFHPMQLYTPEKIPLVHQTIIQQLEHTNYQCYPLVFNNNVTGFFACLSNTTTLSDRFFILDYYIKNFLWTHKWENESQIDEVTGCLNQKSFLQTLFREVSRARRLLLPVSLIILQADQLQLLESSYGTYQVDLFMKALSKSILRDIRSYDTVGMLSNNQLAIILPHTSERGAGMKAEKIRWTVQSSDFSKVFPTHDRLSVSLGLVEYPRTGRSADSMLRYALKALTFAARKCGGNIIAVASPASGFKPDFYVPDSRHHLIRDLT